MPHELFYTSAPRGLKPQSSGFCTVGTTLGFPAPYIARLEALSGYRPPTEGGDIATAPIAYSHWIVEAAGVARHVLSAVGPAAPDHTRRNNKIAHHLVLSDDELIEVGPAWLLAQPGVMSNSWIGEPRLLESQRVLPIAPTLAMQRCATWESICGDAGWAGVIANAVMLDPSKFCSIIYPRGAPVLKLVEEAMALLPAHWRWRVTFTTYFMQPVAGSRCAWRFCLDGTEAATAARGSRETVVDLCAAQPCTQTGTFVNAARTGPAAVGSTAALAASDSSPRPSVARESRSAYPAVAQGQPPAPLELAAAAPECVFGIDYIPDRRAQVRRIVARVGIAAASVLLLTGGLYWCLARTDATERPAPALTPHSTAVAQQTTPESATPPVEQIVELVVAPPPEPTQVDPPQIDPPQIDPAPTTISALPSPSGGEVELPAATGVLTMPTTPDGWGVIKLPTPSRTVVGAWQGEGDLQLALSAPITEVKWAIRSSRILHGFEFGDDQTLLWTDPAGAVHTIARLTASDEVVRFRWCADPATVQSNTKLLQEATRALDEVPIVVTHGDGTRGWYSWEQLPHESVGIRSISTRIAAAGAPWRYSIGGDDWIDWPQAQSEVIEIPVELRVGTVPQQIGLFMLQRKGSNCLLEFRIDPGNDPSLLFTGCEKTALDFKAAQRASDYLSARGSKSTDKEQIDARTKSLETKEALQVAQDAYEAAKKRVEWLNTWSILVGTQEGVPTLVTLRSIQFRQLNRTIP